MDYKAFVEGKKTLLIAPAGYGKTHTIAECLKYTVGKQLVLTHTHAGIASLREKIKKSGISSSSYSIETISGFAQKYVHAFYTGTDLPDQESKEYHPFVVKKAIDLFRSALVKKVIASSYSGLFVDEYQDCTKDQHQMVVALADTLPTHILGDPLQGIFDFNGEAVSFETDLSHFQEFPELITPQRWYQEGNNSGLGDLLKTTRSLLLDKKPISLTQGNGLEVIEVQPGDFLKPASNYIRSIQRLVRNAENKPELESLLILVPEYEELKPNGDKVPKGDIKHRAQIRTQIDFAKSVQLLEAIDDRTFYALAKKSDDLISGIKRAIKKINRIKKDVLETLFNKTDLNVWFNDTGLKAKKSSLEKELSAVLERKINTFLEDPTPGNLYEIVLGLKKDMKLKYKREELLFGYMNALKEAKRTQTSIYEAMKTNRNTIRRSGRKIQGKCIGTTLLTKGLEFDTVIILDAEKFDCSKHLYVALTRGCKRLVIFTTQRTLTPYPI